MIDKDKLEELIKQLKDLRASSKEDYLGRVDYALNMSEQKELTITTPTLTGLRNALQNVEGAQYTKDHPELVKKIKSKLTIDLKKGKQNSKVYEFIGKLAGSKLLEIPHNFANTQLDYDKLLSYVDDVKALKIRHPSNKDIADNKDFTDKKAQSTTKQVKTETGETVETTIINDLYKATNLKGLIEFMSTLPKTYSYQLIITNGEYSDFGALTWAHDLVVALGIETKTPPFVQQFYNDTLKRTISMEVRIANGLITLALSRLAKAQDGLGSAIHARARVNVYDGYRAMPKTTTNALTATYEVANSDPERAEKGIYKGYRTPEAVRVNGGLPMIFNQQLSIFYNSSRTDPEILKMNLPILAKTADIFVNEVVRTGGYTNTPRWSKIADLARPMYAEQIKARGKLDTKYKIAFINNVRALAGTSFRIYDSSSKRNKGGGVYRYVPIIQLLKEDVNKKGIVTHIEWRLTDEYLEYAPKIIHVIVPGLMELQNPQAVMLAMYINNQMAKSERQTEKTVLGEPLTLTAEDLAQHAGIGTGNITHRRKVLTNMLNEITASCSIDKWTTENGDQLIQVRRGKLSSKIWLYPSKYVSSGYVTKRLNTANKQSYRAEQANRQMELKKLDANYRNDFKNSKDATEYRDYLAEDLGITIQELNLMLLKPTKTTGAKPADINDDMLAKIRELAKGFEG